MKCVTLIAALGGITLSVAQDRLLNTRTEIEFEYAPAFREETLVWMGRGPDQVVHCTVQTRSLDDGSDGRWRTIKELTIPGGTFEQLAVAFETKELRLAAERGWPPFPDADLWRLKKTVGSYAVEFRAWNPDMEPEGLPIVRLARRIAETASAPRLPDPKRPSIRFEVRQ